MTETALLAAHDPAPVEVVRPDAPSPVLLACDHADRLVPSALGRLGLADSDFDRHIAYDIGAQAVARGLSERLGATLALQRYSRLVIDCNRRPGVASSIPLMSETTEVPGNQDMSPAARLAREREILAPYHAAVGQIIDQRLAAGRPVLIVTVHSFTPVYNGVGRPWHLGVIHGDDARGATAMLPLLTDGASLTGGLTVGLNEPYRVEMDEDYTLPVHAEARGLVYTEFEIRQDLISDAAGQQAWIDRLAPAIAAWAGQMTHGAANAP